MVKAIFSKIEIFFLKNIILFLLLLPSSCKNFHSINSSSLASAKQQLSQIQLPKVSSKYITIFNNTFANIDSPDDLNENYYDLGANRSMYELNINLSFSSSPLLIKKNSDLIQENIILNLDFNLSKKPHSLAVYKQNIILQSADNIVTSPYANYIESENTKALLVKKAALEIHKYLMIYFLEQQSNKN